MDNLLTLVTNANGFLGFILLFALCGTGLYFTIRLRFVQVRKFGESFRKTFGGIKFGAEAGKDGMSSFQSLATAIAAQVGTGNLAGAATAIATGGPGSIFWMWMSAFFGMSTIFAEATASQKYKTTTETGEVIGGPAYYIRAGIKGRAGIFLSKMFAVCIILALGFFGVMVQSNSIGDSFKTAFNFNPIIVGIAVAVVVMIIVLGGVKRIASITEKMVPFMALIYIVGSLVVIFANIANIPETFRQIFVGAFNPSAVVGGAIGITVKNAVMYGVKRGLFSNEAGMGSTPHAHALAKVKHPCDQGTVAMMGVFIDTFVILTLTALVIISSGALQYTADGATLNGIALTQAAFTSVFGNFGNIFIAICLLFFALSTIIGWYFFGEINVKYLFGQKGTKIYAIIASIFIVLGGALKVDLVWELSDFFNLLMVLPNLIGLLAVGGIVTKLLKEYESDKTKLKPR